MRGSPTAVPALVADAVVREVEAELLLPLMVRPVRRFQLGASRGLVSTTPGMSFSIPERITSLERAMSSRWAA